MRADRLAVRDARRSRDDRGAELALEPLDDHRDVALALRPQQLLAGLGLALDADASGPPRRSRLSAAPILSRSALVCGSIATGSVGRRELDRRQLERLLARRQRVAGVGVDELGDGADLARARSTPTGSVSLPLTRSTWPMRSSSPRSAFQTWSCDAILPEKTRK